jgi:hypothetical protein
MRLARFVVAAAIMFAASAVGGRAFASFRASASGSGRVSVATMGIDIVATTAGEDSAPLHPGGRGDVVLSLRNPNRYPVTLVAVKSTGPVVADPEHNACTSDPMIVTFVAPTDLSTLIRPTVDSSPGPQRIRLAGALQMDLNAPTTCQNARFTVPVTVTVQK